MPAPRKPTALKLLSGSAAHDPNRINKNEPKLPVKRLEPPSFLMEEAKREWIRIVPILCDGMKILTEADYAMLVAYCEAFGDHVRAIKELKADGDNIIRYARDKLTGELILDADDKPIVESKQRHPSLVTKERASVRMAAFAKLFGLDPADRSRVSAQDAGEEVDPMFRLLHGGQG